MKPLSMRLILPILSGLACVLLVGWQGFQEGAVVQTRQVTITFVHDVPERIPPSRSTFRASGNANPGFTVRDYRVGCRTLSDESCIVVTDPDALVPVYHVGDLTTADVEITKPAGEFGWTFPSKIFGWLAMLAFGFAAIQWRRQPPLPPTVPPAPTISIPSREELIGRQLLSIRGYCQPHVEDRTEDESEWWLEFEGQAWLHISEIIAPAFVSPQFLLRFEVIVSQDFPRADSPLPFVTNPPVLAGLLGQCLLAELPDRQDGISQLECRLGFGQYANSAYGEKIPCTEIVLQVGYFEPGKGLDARARPALLSEKLEVKYGKGRKELARRVKFARDNISDPKDKANLERILRFLQKRPGESAGEECEFFIKYTRLYVERGILPDEIERHFRHRQNLREIEENPDAANRRVVPISQSKSQ